MYLADTKDKRGRVHIPEKMRATHMHVVGASNTGKSKLLEHMIREDIKDGKGVCLIDPHGNLYDKIVDWYALNGTDEYRTIHLFEPTADGWSFGFNPLHYDTTNRSEIDFAIDAVVRVSFCGPFRGLLLLRLCGGLLPGIVADMLGVAELPSADQQRDAAGELANVICGNVLPHIAGAHAVFHLSAPEVVPSDAPLSDPEMPLMAEVQLGFEHGRAEVLLFAERTARPALEESRS